MPICWQVHARFGEQFLVVQRESWAMAAAVALKLVTGMRPGEAEWYATRLSSGPDAGHFLVEAGDDWQVLVQRLPDSADFIPGVPLLFADDSVPKRLAQGWLKHGMKENEQ